jgi:hypothetical protein
VRNIWNSIGDIMPGDHFEERGKRMKADRLLSILLFALGAAVESTSEVQKITKVKVYPGADGNFALYQDDGRTYAYEKGGSSLTQLHWDDAGQKLTHEGTPAWAGPDAEMVEIVRH